MKLLFPVAVIALLAACPASSSARRSPGTPPQRPTPGTAGYKAAPARTAPPTYGYTVPKRILDAEARATPGGRAVLATARKMISADTVVIGSCWDYANAVYARAGFRGWRKQKTAYRARTRGPYASPRLVQAGDWLYIINHAATLSTHSVIFVHWVDLARREAKVITYVGGRREDPGMYRTYNVSRIYQIIRPKVPRAAKGTPR